MGKVNKMKLYRLHGKRAGRGAWCACPICEEVAERFRKLDVEDGLRGVGGLDHEANIYALVKELESEEVG